MSATGIQLQQLHPREQEQPTAFADRLGQWYLSRASEAQRRKLGQYFTPVEVARFMAQMYRPTTERLRVLDPGAGMGILACALCESLVVSIVKVIEPHRKLSLSYNYNYSGACYAKSINHRYLSSLSSRLQTLL